MMKNYVEVNINWIVSKSITDFWDWIDITYWFWNTIFWKALLWFTKKWICYLWFLTINETHLLEDFIKNWGEWILFKNDFIIQEYLDDIFLKNKKFDLLLKWTDFQIKVWTFLLKIPKWKITNYQEIANILNIPNSSRALANAIWANNIWYLIPCHRVIRKSWLISWYKRWINRKKLLIDYEFTNDENK